MKRSKQRKVAKQLRDIEVQDPGTALKMLAVCKNRRVRSQLESRTFRKWG